MPDNYARCDACTHSPATPCIGERLPRLCTLPDYYGYLVAMPDPGWRPPTDPTELGPEPVPNLRDAVLACPDRGDVLPVSLQPECGGGGELSECRAGKGTVPGRVTLRDCLNCRSEALGLA